MRFNMNRKLIFGLASASFASLFWACGSGDIVGKDQNDVYVEYSLEDPTALSGLIYNAMVKYCTDSVTNILSEQCLEQIKKDDSNENTQSSSSITPLSPYNNSVSSSPNQQQQTPNSSGGHSGATSSPGQTQNPSSTPSLQPTRSSSSSAAVPTDPNAWGTCAANATDNAIEKGKSVPWKFTPDASKAPGGVSFLTKGTFSWKFDGDGNPSTKSGTGSSYQQVIVTYTTSGEKNASITVTYEGKTNTVQCTPLNVTGTAISGCTCTPNVNQVDIATSTPVTWTVSGCKSSDATFSYIWSDNLSGDASAGGILNTKGTFAPTVTVKNSDNGMMKVTCKEVIAIDSNNPDYIIKAPQAAGAIKLPAGKTTVALQTNGQNNTVFCSVARSDSPSGALNGSVNKIKLAGSDYIAVSVPAGTLTSGKSLDFELDVPATCGIQ